jgi:hypothetical protein
VAMLFTFATENKNAAYINNKNLNKSISNDFTPYLVDLMP